MDLRTKLVFALVGVSLGSMMPLGFFGYQEGRVILERSAMQKLDAVAESRQQDLENVMIGWADRVRLIGSRTQLRLSLASYNETGSESARRTITRILDDARVSVASVEVLAVFDDTGQLVAASWTDPTEESGLELASEDIGLAGSPTDPAFLGLDIQDDGRRHVRYLSQLVDSEATLIGWLSVRLGAAELLTISQDYTGLGQTGETMVVAEEPEGVRVLHPVRHPGLVGGSWIPVRGEALDPAVVAAGGKDTTLATGVTDYRNEPVWAATRFLASSGWGIVVKVDAREEREPIVELRRRLVRLAFSLSAFAILVGILLGLQLTRPIQELVEVANRILGGETDARADVRTQDEVGLLARVFNRMADALTARDVSISDDDLATSVAAARDRLAREAEEAADD
ncbi:MAG: HAMP domain-containing protein [Gemmatimonadota bacterium]